MQITKAGEYALTTMLHLASVRDNGATKISDISKTRNIPDSFLRKIVVDLVKARLVISSRGKNGGLQLARPSNKISLLDVIEATEGKIQLCHYLINPDYRDKSSWHQIISVWNEAHNAFSDILQQNTLADMSTCSEFKKY